MNDPSATDTMRALRSNWPQVMWILAGVLGAGVLFQQFRDTQKSVDAFTAALQAQNDHIQRQEGHLQSIDTNIEIIRDKQTAAEARWNAVTTEASIVIKSRKK